MRSPLSTTRDQLRIAVNRRFCGRLATSVRRLLDVGSGLGFLKPLYRTRWRTRARPDEAASCEYSKTLMGPMANSRLLPDQHPRNSVIVALRVDEVPDKASFSRMSQRLARARRGLHRGRNSAFFREPVQAASPRVVQVRTRANQPVAHAPNGG